MPIKDLRRVNFSEASTVEELARCAEQLQRNLIEVTQDISPRVRAHLSSIVLYGTDGKPCPTALVAAKPENLVVHSLGRKFLGFCVLAKDSAAHVYLNPTSTADLTKFVPLVCSADVNILLEVW